MPEDTLRSDQRRDGATVTLPLVAVLVGLWAIIPPYVQVFGKLDVESRVEFADHVIPGAAVMGVAAFSLVVLRSREPSQLLLFMGGGVITLAGFWMVATHVPLIEQGRDDIAPWSRIAWHFVPGVAVTLLGVLWTVRFWGSDDADEGSSTSVS